MVLLILEGTYPWYRGGVSEWVSNYLSAFSDYDFLILQVATDEHLEHDVNKALYKLPSNVRDFVRIPPPDLEADWDLESRNWLETIRKEIQPLVSKSAIIHVTNTGFAGWLGSELSVTFQKPLILTEHAIYWREIALGTTALECGYRIPAQKHQRKRYVDLFRQMARVIYERSDVVISVSRFNTKRRYSPGRLRKRYIPNGVNELYFRDTTTNLNKSDLRIGWIGRCTNMKNPVRFFSLVEAFRNRPAFPVKFIMLLSDSGDETENQKVLELGRKYPEVKLIWNKAAIDYLDQMDAICITSESESQPLVLFEALAKKVLPVGWEVGDATAEFGLFVDQDTDPPELANRIMLLWMNRTKWSEKVNRHHEYVRRQHTWQVVFSKYREIFDSFTTIA